MPSPRRLFPLLALALTAPSACGPAEPQPVIPAPAPSASASAAPSASVAVAPEPPDGPLPKLRTGALERIEHAGELPGTVVAHSLDARDETLGIQVMLPLTDGGRWPPSAWIEASVPGSDGAHAFAAQPGGVTRDQGRTTTRIVWIHRPRAAAGGKISGDLYTAAQRSEPGHHFRFSAEVPATGKSDPAVITRWARALAGEIHDRGQSPFHRFASERLEALFAEPKKPAKPGRLAPRAVRPPRGELTELMDTTTGAMSIQEALQADRPLLLRAAHDKPTIPIAKLQPPQAGQHPWDDLLRSLAQPPPAEPLAAAVPAEFYYLRAANLDVLFQISDQLDAWATPAAHALDRQAVERDLALRYETQLGLARSALARALGKEVVAEAALTGSDPYLREGSDLSLIFRVKQRALFDAGLAATLATRAGEHGGVSASTAPYHGVDIRIATSADGAVRQHRATQGDLEVVSNSLGALQRILDTLQGKHPRLADEKDFAYLLGRDASVRADALGFMGDRFVAEVVGPRQKVLEARRQIALAELMTPGFAALLQGWMTGRYPATTEELLASRLLAKDELAHGGGAPIRWKPGEPARSVFGTPASLTPLIDLPDPTLVTEAEQDAYDRFSRGYETYWRTYIDPAALRVAIDPSPSGTTLAADLRILPLIDGTDYREILEMAGQARVTAPPLLQGARAVVGIGQNASLRRELSSLSHQFTRKHELALDFLGDWAMLGCEDRPGVADAVVAMAGHLPERPADEDSRDDRDMIAGLARAPAYVAIGIKSMAGATLALAAAHGIAEDVLPGAIRWSEAGRERDVPLVRISVADDLGAHREDRPGRDVNVYYALTGGVFLASLSEHVLRRRVDEVLDGHGPGPATASAPGSQLVLDLSADKQGALFTVLSWLLTEETLDAAAPSRALAEALRVGGGDWARDEAGARALALATFGEAPVTADGRAFGWGPDGVRDPLRGTPSAPVWPALPVPGSPVDKLLGAVGRFRSEVAFDREGPGKGSGGLLSLHAHVTLGLRGE